MQIQEKEIIKERTRQSLNCEFGEKLNKLIKNWIKLKQNVVDIEL